MSKNIIQVENIKKSYEDGRIHALNGVDLNIVEGEFVSIIGPSGSGKSTLLNMLGGLDKPDSGSIIINNEDITKTKDLSNFRAKTLGFIFQLHNLIPNMSALENVEIPMYGQKIKSKEMTKRALELLDIMGIKEKAHRKPSELSGGERQRVAIARSLANNPSIILADEPTGSLDSKNGDLILEHLKKLHNEKKVTLIVVTHDMRVAEMADRIVKVLDGKIVN